MAQKARVAEGLGRPTAPVAGHVGDTMDNEEIVLVRLVDGGERVVLVGELCYASVPSADDRLRRLERCDLPIRTLDLTELDFIDLPGLDLVEAWEARQRRQGRGAQIIPGPRLARLWQLVQAGKEAALHERARGVERPTSAMSDAVAI